MRCVWVRMMALLLAVLLAVGVAGTPVRAAQAGQDTEAVSEASRNRAEVTVFTVLGLAFLCAGGMVALIMAKDRT